MFASIARLLWTLQRGLTCELESYLYTKVLQ